MAFEQVPPLDWQTPIVDPNTGFPSSQFMRIWQQNFQNTDSNKGDAELALERANEAEEGVDQLHEVDIIAGTGLDGGGSLGDAPSDITLDLADTAVTPDTYGDSTHVAQITVDQQGRITAATDVAIAGGGGGGNWWFDPPAAADFPSSASGDAGSVTLSDDSDVGLIADGGTAGASDDVRVKYKTLPSGDFTMSARLTVHTGSNNNGGGIILLETGTSKIVNLGWLYNSVHCYRGNLNTYSTGINSFGDSFGGALWVRINRTGSTYTFYSSRDGKAWVFMGTVAATTAFTTDANAIGVGFVYNSADGKAPVMSIDHWDGI